VLRPLRATQLALAIGTCERAASPVLLTACALLPRCRQPQLRAVGLDGHRALDVSATTSRRNVDSSDTMIRPPSRAARVGRGHPRGFGFVGALLDPLTIECSAVCSGLIIHAMTASTSTTAASSGHDPPRALALSPLAASLTEMESDSIMLEAPALSAWRVGAMLIPSAGVYPCLHSPAV
jgi:hypothetical protein